MNFAKLFKGKETVDALVQRWQHVQQGKAELVEKESQLKREALYADSLKDLSGQLSDIRLQLELSEAAEAEIKTKLKELLAVEVERDYQQLTVQKEKYETAFNKALAEAGEALARAVQLLGSIGRARAGTLASEIRGAVDDLANGNQGEVFAALVEAFNSAPRGAAAMDFDQERGRLKKIEDRAPGTPGAQAYIVGKIMNLLDLRSKTHPWNRSTEGI